MRCARGGGAMQLEGTGRSDAAADSGAALVMVCAEQASWGQPLQLWHWPACLSR